MSEVFLAVPGAHETFSAVNHTAGESVISAGMADYETMLGAVAAAIGPIGLTSYVPAFGQALTNNLTGTLQVGQVHHAIGLGTTVHKAAIVALDELPIALDELA